MLAKNCRPIISKLARMGFSDPATSPRSPLDAKIQSPKGKYDVGGVGLGIVVTLEKSNNPVLVRSNPIPVKQESNNCTAKCMDEMKLLDWDEEYTIVTRHEPNKSYSTSTSTRVYCDRVGHDRRSRNIAVFDISPPRFSQEHRGGSDFLSCCHLCQKKLHGKDIYMYRGEKAFCSTECRYQQIVMDERKEKQQQKQKRNYYCSSEASSRTSSSSPTNADVSSSPYANGGQMFYTGILAV